MKPSGNVASAYRKAMLAIVMPIAAATAVDRDLSIVSVTDDSVTLSISPGDSAGYLRMSSGIADAGTNLATWATVSASLAKVSAEGGTLVVPLPDGWNGSVTALRFLLSDEPYDYAVEYLGSTGTQYVDTCFTNAAGDMVELDFDLRDEGRQASIYGARNFAAAKNISVVHDTRNSNTDSVVLDYNNSNSYESYRLKSGTRAQGRYHVVLDADKRVIDRPDGVSLTNTTAWSSAFECAHSAYLFAANNNGGGALWNIASMCLRSGTITRDGSIVCRFVPCVKDGVPAIYDAVRGIFLWNAGTGTFETGTAIPGGGLTVRAISEPLFSSCRRAVSVVGATCRNGVIDKFLVEIEAGTSTQALYVAYGANDSGESMAGWEHVSFVANVPAESSKMGIAVPLGWGDTVEACRFFLEGDGVPPHPYDYAVEYLGATGTQYVDTCFTNSAGDTIELEFDMCSQGERFSIFGSRNAANVLNISVAHDTRNATSDSVVIDYNNSNDYESYRLKSGTRALGRYHVVLGADKRIIDRPDQTSVTNSTVWSGSFTCAHPAYLFAVNDNGGGVLWGAAAIRFRSGTVTRGNNVVCRLVPCVKDGVPAIYDAVRDMFLYNAGTGTFETGERCSWPTAKVPLAASEAITPATALRISGLTIIVR